MLLPIVTMQITWFKHQPLDLRYWTPKRATVEYYLFNLWTQGTLDLSTRTEGITNGAHFNILEYD